MSERFARHDLVPGWRQDRLGSTTAVIVGVGALGNEVARTLAMAGIGHLVLCDPDVVAESNLSRTVLFRARDIGRNKVDAAAEALADLAPAVKVRTVAAPHLNGLGLAGLRDADLVVSCLDSMAARIALTARCNAVRTRLVDAGTHPWGGQVTYVAPGGACLACGLTDRERAVVDDPWSCDEPVADVAAGASAPISALLGAWQTTVALRVLFGLRLAGNTLRVESTGVVEPVTRSQDPECPLHEWLDPDDVEPLGEVETAGDVVKRLAPEEEAFTWTSLPGGTTLVRTADPSAQLVDLGVAGDEILPVARRGERTVTRYLELGRLR
ncbi:HesA/MoeB/ThiF family protein [Actinocrispum wychmicini]|uniref:Molybdopterin/thiamine biosynthesis adenylyltransferase n=1 Tax=Actinocrispum wychmicini TaxID=1213861 RepID=A0A4R2JRI4_9PSEU|nr:ThiF family adenylyltransferase [Actinocrispum wychmicini]TCO59828.1 molybdopterin/thiamine biosynthesis adenylyltransferase [Actinocrispum wychmicini]